MRILVAATALCMSVAGYAAAPQALAAVREATHIESQALEPALQILARERGLQIVYRSEVVGDLRTSGASGELTLTEVLEKLLSGSGLTFQYVDDETVTILPADAQPPKTRPRPNASSPTRMEQHSGGPQIEEIIVTATKRAQSVQSIPMSVAVLTGEAIERRSMVSLGDFMRHVPGVTLADRGPGFNTITIRGIYNNLSSDRTTGVYLGDIPLTALGVYNDPDIKLVDMERVEVLRGPQGTLYGASSMGGALRYIPNAPDLQEIEGKINATYSTTSGTGGDSGDVTGVVNIPLIDSKLALRVAGYYFDNAGHIDYVGGVDPSRAAFAAANGARFTFGSHGGASTYAGGRLGLSWKPLENVSAVLTYLNQQLDQDGSAEDSLKLKPYQDAPLSFGDRTPGGRELRFHDAELFNLALDVELRDLEVISSTSHAEYRGGERRDVSRDLPYAIGVISDTASSATTQEVRASSDFAGRLNFLAGLYYEDNQWSADLEEPWLGDVALCCGGLGSDPANILIYRDRISVKQKAVFSELYVDLNGQLRLTLGGRFFDYERSTSGSSTGFLGSPREPAHQSQDGSTFKANLSYSINEDHLLYLQWAEGFRLGRPTIQVPALVCDQDGDGILDGTAATPVDAHDLQPDTLDSWELGIKSAFADRRWIVSAAIYQLDWRKIPGTVAGACGFSVSLNAGGARSRGFEVESSIALTPDLRLELGASLIDGELTTNADTLAAQRGDPLPAADFQANIGVQYDFRVFSHPSFVRADYAYTAGYHSTFARRGAEIGNYGKTDFRAGMDFGRVGVALYGSNLTNQDNITYADSFNRIWRLRPRTVGFDLRYSF